MSTDSFRYLFTKLADTDSKVAELQPCLKVLIASCSHELSPQAQYALEDLLEMAASTGAQITVIHYTVMLLLNQSLYGKDVDSNTHAA